MLFNATVIVKFKKSVLEPQGKAIGLALAEQGHTNFKKVRVGKFIEIEVEAQSEKEALQKVRHTADELLHNNVMETCEIHLEKV